MMVGTSVGVFWMTQLGRLGGENSLLCRGDVTTYRGKMREAICEVTH